MTLPADLATATATELSEALRRREVGAMELTDAAISRIEGLDGPINAVVVRDFDRARDAARAADAALARGERRPLLGVPMTVKEAHNVAGLPTTWGIPAHAGWIAPEDAVAVARLKAAGAVILGKTNVPPALADWQSANRIHGRTNNPLDPTRTPGGSSGGSSAALAAGMVPLELGSDIAGSIRVPAAFCGVLGQSPAMGSSPCAAALPLAWSAPPCPSPWSAPWPGAPRTSTSPWVSSRDPTRTRPWATASRSRPHAARLSEFRVLVLDRHPTAELDAEIRAALHRLGDELEGLGAAVARGSHLLPDLASAHRCYLAMLTTITTLGGPPGRDSTTAHEWIGLLGRQLAVRNRWRDLFEAFDVVLAPTFGTVAFPHDDRDMDRRTLTIDGRETPYGAQMAWSGMASLANLPATALPIGRTAAGLPIGVQAMGPYLEDRTTIAFAALVEREFGGVRHPAGGCP